jgi:hypothetical protein
VNDADAIALGNTYRVSYYEQFAHVDPRNKVAGSSVPRVSGADLVRVMTENVDAARMNRDSIKARMEKATLDGLFDTEALDATTAEQPRKIWLEAIQAQYGDKIRCLAELTHWRSYLRWAMSLIPEREMGDHDDE